MVAIAIVVVVVVMLFSCIQNMYKSVTYGVQYDCDFVGYFHVFTVSTVMVWLSIMKGSSLNRFPNAVRLVSPC